MYRLSIILIAVIFSILPLHAQELLRGVVTDCRTGDPLAFVNLITADGVHGTSTDIEGRFELRDLQFPVGLRITYVGYAPQDLWLTAPERRLQVELCPKALNLSEVVILPWDNPALGMMRKVVENRHRHDPARLESYTCDAYGKMVFTADTTRIGSPDFSIPDSTLRKIRELLNAQHLFIMETASERT
ncbi:MAG: carboxypeptidase-like regulatory domain-containing protein, partial [Bacteroidales bacterium]|nr:carboxypeptidase-like regulatory domain-containing protein [Bacteroidales bacterium]